MERTWKKKEDGRKQREGEKGRGRRGEGREKERKTVLSPRSLHVILSYPGGLISRGLCTSLREGWHQVNPSPRSVFHEEKYEQDDSESSAFPLSLSLCPSVLPSVPPSCFKSLRGTYSGEIISRERATEYTKIKIRARRMVR